MDTTPRVGKERISEVVGHLRGVGGLPLAPNYVKSIRAWLCNMANRGFLDVAFLSDRELVRETFMTSYQNSHAQFTRAILAYFSALTEEEFDRLPRAVKGGCGGGCRAVATQANKEKNDFFSKRA